MKGNELKPHIGIFGRRNYGKSTLINVITGQNIAIVSDTAGTTTDPVKKTMEIKGVGPVVWIDTAGVDDEGDLGLLRIQKTNEVLRHVDLALIVFSANTFGKPEEDLINACTEIKIPFILVYSKTDIFPPTDSMIEKIEKHYSTTILKVSQHNSDAQNILLDAIRSALPETAYTPKSLLGDVINTGDTIVLVTPIDSSAPEGRMILPQVQTIRDILDNECIAIVCKETHLEQQLKQMATPPALVVTDSQVFKYVSDIVPANIPLTSFSIVLAHAKGLFYEYIEGTPTLDSLYDGDSILMLESCTHKASCEDIGRVKLPNLIRKYSGKEITFDHVSGLTNLDKPITNYRMVIQCGGCVVTPKQLANRLQVALNEGIPVSNYGLAIAYMTGIFDRAIQVFKNK
ncbi:MAG: [FeFe] hydrogenase H-cluster maturation GTPase HydF [Bacteroidales bacterium]|nr:[FeFe] hydrogenase H-cluster maturation GTPase HydF [Bacteroidales bacterium]